MICLERVVPERGMPMMSTGVASPTPSSGARAISSGVQRAIRRSVSPREGRRVEHRRAAAHGVGRVKMLHRQCIVAEIVRALADRKMQPQALRQLRPARVERRGHSPQ